MLILCTGISGSGAEQYLENVCKLKKIKVFNIGEMIFDIAKKQHRPITRTKILDKPDPELDPYRAAAFEKILREAKKYKDIIIRTHACFRWKYHLRKAFDLFYLEELQPDYYITLIDSVSAIKCRQEKNPQWRGKMSIKEIMIWRDEETLLTELMANYQQKSFYIVANEEPPETFVNLVYRNEIPKIYLSYPISHMTKKKEEWIKEKNQIRERLRKSFVVFDPLDIKDVTFLGEAIHAKEKNEKTFYSETIDEKFEFGTEEVIEAKNDIYLQTVPRDFKLIDQSNMVVVLYPEPVRSHGVSNEVRYGSSNKDVYIVTPLGEDPFTEYDITERFKSIDDLLGYLKAG